MQYIAHKTDNGLPVREQSVQEHLKGVAQLAGTFAASFGAGQEGRRVGLSHDAGKYGSFFQRRIRGENIQVDHATPGAKILLEQGDPWAALAVAGHHCGLPDYGARSDTEEEATLVGRTKRKLQDCAPFFQEIQMPPPAILDFVAAGDGFIQSFFTRMLYSCLVDADFLDTEQFLAEKAVLRGGYDDIAELKARFDRYADLHWNRTDTPLNRTRLAIRLQCQEMARQKPGLFSLTVPTGGGKTAASMAFALHHAEAFGKRRVIYVIPYTSIIEQNSEVFAQALGPENVIQHHHNVDFPEPEQETPEDRRRKLATENWDAPIIMTTAVQFLESLFAAKPSRCRKLHNIANSVVIFDEAQMLPTSYLRPCVAAISQLVAHYGVTAVLCTATQPSLGDMFAEFLPGSSMVEICPEIDQEIFRRVRYSYEPELPWDSLPSRLQAECQVLCIVNTRRRAEQLFRQLTGEGNFHLSTRMTPRHRREKLEEIRKRLIDGLPCRVVSTSLVEAGVDVDFPAVYRELAGIDSLVQAAGRCNREGKRPPEDSVVHIFRTGDTPPELMAMNVGAAEYVLARVGLPDNSGAVSRYFRRLYRNAGPEGLDQESILPALREGISGCMLPLRTVSERFRLIKEDTYPIYIPNKENAGLLNALRSGQCSRTLLRRLGQDCVSVYLDQYRQLLESGCLEEWKPGAAILARDDCYDQCTGLLVDAQGGCAIFA